ncbi:response regulator transcription factor [Fodinisporobacter ferrooxydans]|uniref:Response regulator transcription factor n=1 Tax=Fodinisporobacter ferrooxydans TaxID=2901836 RepID=A0ABY4CJB4_9BACL|nr:response regulator transcription factor [Alicyclobacillaceae bacterium MYW30-H2]
MWKVVIVDDDQQTLNGMKKVIPWEQLQAECVGECIDGKEGLETILSIQADLVLTDIYMPVMNGLEMIEQLRQQGYKGKIIILSGYSDFEYARKALRLQVDDYLSKPLSVQTLKQVLETSFRKLEEEEAQKILLEKMSTNFFNEGISNEIPQEVTKAIRPFSFYHQLAGAVRLGLVKQSMQTIDEYKQRLDQVKEITPPILQQQLYEIWGVLAYALHDVGIFLDEIFPNLDVQKEIRKIYTTEQMDEWLSRKVHMILMDRQWNENVKHKQAVEFMVQYIQEHYGEDVTIGDLAEKLFISRNHLSQIFKKIMGETFNTYLTQYRMEKAKTMILEGNYLIYEVAEKVGYKNIPYFSTLFKKYTGFTPSELQK